VATRRCTVRRDDVDIHAHCSSRKIVTRAMGVLGVAGAAIVGNLTAVRKMLDKRANASKSSNKLRTPLHFAAQEVMTTERNLSLFPIFSGTVACTQACRPEAEIDCLHCTAQGHLDVVKALLKAGVKVDVQDSRLSTPAHLAVRHGHLDVVRALLLSGCNLNKRDHHRRNVWNEARQVVPGRKPCHCHCHCLCPPS
jgi:hypothetical protein